MNTNDTIPSNHPMPNRQQQQQQQRKKCHGNRKDQRFRKKCRTQGMKPELIEKLLNKRKRDNQKKNQTKKRAVNTTNNQGTTAETAKVSDTVSRLRVSAQSQPMMTTAIYVNKRKREAVSLQQASQPNPTMPKSTSSISILQPDRKKSKNKIMTPSSSVTFNSSAINHNYRRPMYLERSSSIVFRMLNKRLNDILKTKDEQRFIYARLALLDQHYCLVVDQKLWQSYLDIGREQHKWPEQLCIMSKTDDFDQCQEYLINYIRNIKKQLDDHQIELTKQSQLCPITLVPLNQIDHYLKEFVDCQRKYLSTRNNKQLIKFKDDIQENALFEIITTYYPTMDQNALVNQLITIREKQSKVWEEQLMLEMRILCKFLPQNFDHLQHFISPITYEPLNHDQQKVIQFKHQHYRMIQEAKRIWLDISLSIYEINLQKYDQQYQQILIQLESLVLNNTSVDGVSLFNNINRYMTYRTHQIKQDICNKLSVFQGKIIRHRQCSSVTKNMIGVSPEPFLDLISNPFNTHEWNYLSLGSSCIRINQSAIRSTKQQNIQIKDQHKDIYNKVENHLFKYQRIPRTASIFKGYSHQLLNHLNQCYFAPLSYKDRLQAHEQAHIAHSIRSKIQKHKLILRVTDKGNNFYMGSRVEFEKKAQKYFSDTNAFSELTYNPFNEILDKVIHTLKTFGSKKLILQWQEKRMLPDPKKSELSHLYFNPKTHKDDIPVRPIENTIHAPTTNISKFLDHHLRPLFHEKCKTTTIIDGAHLIKELNIYSKKDLFKPSTLFCTFDIHNLYTMLPQDEALNILVEFLSVHGYRKVKGIALDTIRKLASIVLKENAFVYGKKIYKQVLGGAMGSSFTLTLANIFMWKWQKKFVDQQKLSGEYFGRYIDDIFMTWNKSEKELIELLNDANTWHPNIKLDYKIGQSLPFLNILITNNNGILSTSVYHKPAAEPYVVPYISDHPRHVFGNIIQNGLTQAIRYSSTFEAFQKERRNIRLKLLYNGYPSSIIDKEFQKFFLQYISSLPFLPFIENQKEFSLMRNKIKSQPTPRQSQVAIDVAQATINNDQTDEEQIETKERTNKTKNPTAHYENKLILHYTHEKRFASTKRDLHRNYNDVFKNTPAMDVTMIVGNRNRRTAKNDLIHKKPRKSILKNQPFKKRSRRIKKNSIQ